MSDKLSDDVAPGAALPGANDQIDKRAYKAALDMVEHFKTEAERLSKVAKKRGGELVKATELVASYRSKSNAAAWESAAAKAGISPEMTADALALSGLKLDGDVEAKTIEDAIAGLKSTRKWMFQAADPKTKSEAATEPEPEPAASPPATIPLNPAAARNPHFGQRPPGSPPAPSSGKQGGSPPSDQGTRFTAADLRNPAKMVGQPKDAKIEALKRGVASSSG